MASEAHHEHMEGQPETAGPPVDSGLYVVWWTVRFGDGGLQEVIHSAVPANFERADEIFKAHIQLAGQMGEVFIQPLMKQLHAATRGAAQQIQQAVRGGATLLGQAADEPLLQLRSYRFSKTPDMSIGVPLVVQMQTDQNVSDG